MAYVIGHECFLRRYFQTALIMMWVIMFRKGKILFFNTVFELI